MPRRTRCATAFAVAAIAGLSAAPAVRTAVAAPGGCSGYDYAGVVGRAPAQGVAATLTAVSVPALDAGHVAAWVGVGGAGLGAGGADEWIQAGLSREPGGELSVYREVEEPGASPSYEKIADAGTGIAYRVTVTRVHGDRWRVSVDGRRVGAAVRLPGSAAWRPVATAESWLPATSPCNPLAFRFDTVQAMSGGRWRPLTDLDVVATPHYAVARHGDSFRAATLG